jgi:hypothetical protein
MKKDKTYRYLASQKGESNAKLIVALVVVAVLGYIIYSIMPLYYKEQQLSHDIKEEARIAAVNGRDVKLVEKSCQKIVDDINFPADIKTEVVKNGDNLTIKCKGTVPVNFFIYSYPYNVNVVQTAGKGGY